MHRARLLLPLLIAAALTACGGDAVSLDPVASAATKTSEVASARFFMDMTITDPDTGEPLHLRGPGVIADHGRLLAMKMRLDETKDAPAFTTDTIMTQDAIYLRSRLFKAVMPRGKEWLKAEEDDPVGDIGQNDPGQMLDYLRAAGDIEKTGSGTVRGVATTKYRARIVLDKVVEKVPEDRRARIEHAIDVLGEIGVEEIPMTVWVDNEGLVRRLTMDWVVKNPDDPSEKFQLKAAVDMFDFGTKARVELPPAGKTMSYDAFLESGGGG